MPAAALKSLAKQAGVSLATAERYWEQAKKQAEEKFGKVKEDGRGSWQYIMGIVKKRLGLTKEDLVAVDWPIRLVIEAEVVANELSQQKDYVFSTEDMPGDQRLQLLKSLKDQGLTIVWEFLEGEVLYLPGLTEDQFGEIAPVFKEFKITVGPMESLCNPLLVALFLKEFYNVMELQGDSKIVAKGGDCNTEKLVEEILLLETGGSYKQWLLTIFPNVSYELISFLADQGAKE